MPSEDFITIAQLMCLAGTAEAPIIVDLRTEEDFAKSVDLAGGAPAFLAAVAAFRLWLGVLKTLAAPAAAGLLLRFAAGP